MMQQVETLPLLNRRKRKPGKEPVDQARKVRSGALYKWAPGLVCEALIDRLAIGSRQMEEQQFDDIAELEKALEDDRPSYWPDLISTPATRERAAFLAKKRNGCLPPGQAKKRWRVGRPLPREVIFHDLPPPLVVELGPPPLGYRYARVANDVLLLAIGTGMVVDAITDLGRM